MLWCSASQYRVKPSRSAAWASRTVAASASAVDWSVRTGTRSRTDRRTTGSTRRGRRTFPAQPGVARRVGEDVVEHRRGEPAGEHVLLTGVIAAEQPQRRAEFGDRAVAELRFR